MLTEKEKTEALKLLMETIEFVTVNPDGNEKELAEYIAATLKSNGCPAQVHSFAPQRANVMARLAGHSPGQALLLNGHLDTVPFGSAEEWKMPPDKATLQNGKLYGRGASDMKSGLCALLYAFLLLLRQKFVPKHDIIFAATADEESQGLGAQDLLSAGIMKEIKAVLIAEPTGGQIGVASKGALWLEITVYGKTSHGAYPEQGLNAAQIALELYLECSRLISGNKGNSYFNGSSCTLTQIKSGVKANVVPDRCIMTLDVRTVPGENALKFFEQAKQKIEERYAEVRIEHQILNHRIPVEVSSDDVLIKELSDAVERVQGTPPKLVGTGFFSDASLLLLDKMLPCVLFGPGNSEQAHKPNEYVCVEAYFKAIESLYHFLSNQ